MNKMREYRIKVDALRDVVDSNCTSYANPLTYLLNTYGEVYAVYQSAIIDRIQDRITKSQFDVITNALDNLYETIKIQIVRYLLDKYNKK